MVSAIILLVGAALALGVFLFAERSHSSTSSGNVHSPEDNPEDILDDSEVPNVNLPSMSGAIASAQKHGGRVKKVLGKAGQKASNTKAGEKTKSAIDGAKRIYSGESGLTEEIGTAEEHYEKLSSFVNNQVEKVRDTRHALKSDTQKYEMYVNQWEELRKGIETDLNYNNFKKARKKRKKARRIAKKLAELEEDSKFQAEKLESDEQELAEKRQTLKAFLEEEEAIEKDELELEGNFDELEARVEDLENSAKSEEVRIVAEYLEEAVREEEEEERILHKITEIGEKAGDNLNKWWKKEDKSVRNLYSLAEWIRRHSKSKKELIEGRFPDEDLEPHHSIIYSILTHRMDPGSSGKADQGQSANYAVKGRVADWARQLQNSGFDREDMVLLRDVYHPNFDKSPLDQHPERGITYRDYFKRKGAPEDLLSFFEDQ